MYLEYAEKNGKIKANTPTENIMTNQPLFDVYFIQTKNYKRVFFNFFVTLKTAVQYGMTAHLMIYLLRFFSGSDAKKRMRIRYDRYITVSCIFWQSCGS